MWDMWETCLGKICSIFNSDYRQKDEWKEGVTEQILEMLTHLKIYLPFGIEQFTKYVGGGGVWEI